MKRERAERLEIVVKSQEKLILGLEDNCQKWSDKVHRLYAITDIMAERCKDEDLRQAYWEEKSRA